MTFRRTTTALAVVLLGAASCGGGGSSKSSSALNLDGKQFKDHTGKATVDVDAVDNSFTPKYITVSAGTKVKFKNDGHNEHNVIAANEGAFKSALQSDFQPGTTVTVTFAKAGDYPYYCSLHGTATVGMVGGVRVVK